MYARPSQSIWAGEPIGRKIVSTFVLMKLLESSSRRYDCGIRVLTLGRLDKAYQRLAGRLEKQQRVLDLGCGTGVLTLQAARRGAWVKGIDINTRMLAIARGKVEEEGLDGSVSLCEMGVAELGSESTGNFDAVTAGLSLSELNDEEIAFTLKQVHRILKPQGLLLVADEAVPGGFVKKLLHLLIRIPLVLLTYLLTQTTTRAAKDLPQRIENTGFRIEELRRSVLEDFVEITARKQKDA